MKCSMKYIWRRNSSVNLNTAHTVCGMYDELETLIKYQSWDTGWRGILAFEKMHSLRQVHLWNVIDRT